MRRFVWIDISSTVLLGLINISGIISFVSSFLDCVVCFDFAFQVHTPPDTGVDHVDQRLNCQEVDVDLVLFGETDFYGGKNEEIAPKMSIEQNSPPQN